MLEMADEREHGEVIARMSKINGGKRKMETF